MPAAGQRNLPSIGNTASPTLTVTLKSKPEAQMKQVDKIELMKYSLYQLVDMLRPQDKIGLVTYASDARVLMKSTKGSDKELIKEEVSKLKAFGYTAGGSGIITSSIC